MKPIDANSVEIARKLSSKLALFRYRWHRSLPTPRGSGALAGEQQKQYKRPGPRRAILTSRLENWRNPQTLLMICIEGDSCFAAP